MSFAAFRERHRGKSVGSGQCVALARLWIGILEDGDGFRTMPRVAAAKDFWDVAPADHWIRKSSGTPPIGALVIFKPTSSNPYGHVAIARAGNSDSGDLVTFDQNYSRPDYCTDETHTRSAAYGWLVFKEEPLPQFTDEEAKQLKNLLRGCSKYRVAPYEIAELLKEADKRITSLEKKIAAGMPAAPHTHKAEVRLT